MTPVEHFRESEDDVEAATPVDAQNAPTGVWKSRKKREISTSSTSIICFSGRWTTDPDSTVTTPAPAGRGSTARGEMGSAWGLTITIAQDPTQLTVESAVFTRYDLQPPLKFVYSLDGSETRLKQLSPLWLCLASRRRPGQLVSVAAPARRKSRGVWPVHRRKKRWNAAGSE